MKTVLLLAGTAQARALAEAFDHPGARLLASLAGATAAPRAYPCETRTGGFGGVEGLRAYLHRARIAALVDATHPFAARISANAQSACAGQGVPLLVLDRPPWEPVGEWHSFGTLAQAVAALPSGARVLATTGRKDTGAFEARGDLAILLRSVDPPDDPPPHITPLAARGPFALEDEIALMRAHRITHLLTRNAGGESRARLDAAAGLCLPIHMVERPPGSAAEVAHSVADALRWLRRVLGD